MQRKLKSRRRPRQAGEISLFAGLIKCGECGKSLTIRYTNEKHPKQIYSCKTYNAYEKQHCSQHRVEYDTLYRLVLNKIRECARIALMDGKAVAMRNGLTFWKIWFCCCMRTWLPDVSAKRTSIC